MAGTPKAEIEVTGALVRDLIAEQHPRYAALPVGCSGEGWDNYTFRLGNDLAVRLPRRAAGLELIRNEQRWLADVARRVAVSVPAPVATGLPGLGYPWPWSIVPWIEGTPVDLAPLGAGQGEMLATFLRAVHKPASAEAPENPYRGVPLEARRERVSACLDRLAQASDVVTPSVLSAWREALAAPCAEDRVWLHGDLHAQNVLSRDGRLVGVIDWGDICAGDPATDLGSVWGLLSHRSARSAAIAHYAPDPALLARARGWAIVFGATLFENGGVDDPRHAAIGEMTLRRLAEDLS